VGPDRQKCLENAENRKPIASHEGLLYQGRQELVASREFFPPTWTEAKSADEQLAFAMVKIPRRRSQVSLFCLTWTNSSLFRTMANWGQRLSMLQPRLRRLFRKCL
jgi:hypothetical protein